MEKKVLVAVDNSEYCQNILRYLCRLFSKQSGIRFHLLSIVPCYLGQAGREWLDQQDLMAIVDSATRKKFQAYTLHMHKVKGKFMECGFQEDQLETEVRLSKEGIAAEIVHEAQKGLHDAIVVGKKDLSLLEKMVAGSTSAEILKKNDGLPVWIVNGKTESQKSLVPVDCTPHTLDAVDHLAFILKENPHAEITLFHSCSLFSSEYVSPKKEFYEKWGRDWCDEHLQGDADGHFHFHAPEQILKEAGFPLEHVHRLQTDAGIEPGQQIAHHVKHDTFGTIVMGRRHKDISKGIFKGVSDRVLANVKDVAVWIIG